MLMKTVPLYLGAFKTRSHQKILHLFDRFIYTKYCQS